MDANDSNYSSLAEENIGFRHFNALLIVESKASVTLSTYKRDFAQCFGQTFTWVYLSRACFHPDIHYTPWLRRTGWERNSYNKCLSQSQQRSSKHQCSWTEQSTETTSSCSQWQQIESSDWLCGQLHIVPLPVGTFQVCHTRPWKWRIAPWWLAAV